MKVIKLIFEIFTILFVVLQTLGRPVLISLFYYVAVFIAISLRIGVLLSIALLLTGEKLGCCVFLGLSFLLFPGFIYYKGYSLENMQVMIEGIST